MQDWELLQDFVKNGSQDSFSLLVERHLDFVYSTCWREIGDTGLAEDATQVVFLLLSRKATTLREGTVLAGWLFQTARFVARNTKSQETRWRERNRKAAEAMIHEAKTPPPSPEADEDIWTQIQPHLHDAMGQLGAVERNAVLLRCFKGYSLKATGETLGLTEEAARKRVSRALEKMRRYFTRRGVTLSAAVLAGLLTNHAVQAAPVSLAAAGAITGVIFQAASTSTLTGGLSVSVAEPLVGTSSGLGSATGSTVGASGTLLGGKAFVLTEMVRNAEQALLVAKIKVAATAICGVSLATAGTEQVVQHLRPVAAHSSRVQLVTPQKKVAALQWVNRKSFSSRKLASLPPTVASPQAVTSFSQENKSFRQPEARKTKRQPTFTLQSAQSSHRAKQNAVISQTTKPKVTNQTDSVQRIETMQTKKQIRQQIAKIGMGVGAKMALLTGAVATSVWPVAAQPNINQRGTATNKANGALPQNAAPLPNQGGNQANNQMANMLMMQMADVFNRASAGQGNTDMLRAKLQAQGVTDEATLSAVMEHVKRVEAAQQVVSQKSTAMNQGMAPNTTVSDAQFNVLFNAYQAAVEDYKAVREKSARQLDEKIGYSQKNRLHAALMSSGIVGDAPQAGAGFNGFGNGFGIGVPNGFATGGTRTFTAGTGQQPRMYVNGAPVPLPEGMEFPGFPGLPGGAGGFGNGFGNGGAGGLGNGGGNGNAGGFANGGAGGNGNAGGFGNGAALPLFDVPAINGFGSNANNDQTAKWKTELDAQMKLLRDEIDRLKAEKNAAANKANGPK